MPTQLEFIGADERWFETAVTGKSRVWSAGRIAEVADADAAALLGTGKFRRQWAVAQEEDGTPAGLTTAELAALRAGGFVSGLRVVTAFDSETDIHEASPVPDSVADAITYNQATGVITVKSTNHGCWTGRMVRFWNYNYPSVRDQRFLPMTRVDANTYTITLQDKPQDIPNGNLATTHFAAPVGTLSWAHWLGLFQMRNGHMLDIVRNAAQAGDTCAGFYGRIDRDVLAWNPHLIIGQITGLNDQVGTNTNSWQESAAWNRKSIDKMMSQGAKLILLTTNPVASGEARANPAAMQRIININRDAVMYCRGKAGVQVVDAYSAAVDPMDPSGFAVDNRLKGDNIHWNHTGSMQVLPKLEAAIRNWFLPGPNALVKSTLDCHQNNKDTVVSMNRAADGLTVTVITSNQHSRRPGDELRILGLASVTERGRVTVSEFVSTTSYRYLKAGPPGAIAAGGAVITSSRNAWNNPLFAATTGGTVTGTAGLTGTAAARIQVSTAFNAGNMTAVASVGPASDGPNYKGVGNAQKISVTASNADGRPAIGVVGSSAFAFDLMTDSEVRFRGRYFLHSDNWAGTPINEIFSAVSITWSTGEVYSVAPLPGWDGAENPTIAADFDVMFDVGLPTVPPQPGSTITNASFVIYPRFSGTLTSPLTIELSQLSVDDVWVV